jgi:hypothetical protein
MPDGLSFPLRISAEGDRCGRRVPGNQQSHWVVVQLLSALMKGNSSAEYVFKIGALWIYS